MKKGVTCSAVMLFLMILIGVSPAMALTKCDYLKVKVKGDVKIAEVYCLHGEVKKMDTGEYPSWVEIGPKSGGLAPTGPSCKVLIYKKETIVDNNFHGYAMYLVGKSVSKWFKAGKVNVERLSVTKADRIQSNKGSFPSKQGTLTLTFPDSLAYPNQ